MATMATTTNNMSDETLLTDNALKGKIARLPAKIREEVCSRVHDGQPGSKLLPWLNSLPEVKVIIDAQFEGVPVSDVNLSVWRRTGYQDWVKRRERVDRIRELSQVAADLAKAGGGTIATGAANIASGKLLEMLEEIDNATEQKLSPEALADITKSLAMMRAGDQTDVKLALEKRKLGQKDEEIQMDRARFQRETCELFLQWFEKKQAVEIASGDASFADKIENLGQLMFADQWRPTVEAQRPAKK